MSEKTGINGKVFPMGDYGSSGKTGQDDRVNITEDVDDVVSCWWKDKRGRKGWIKGGVEERDTREG